jgi:hypothetical protein
LRVFRGGTESGSATLAQITGDLRMPPGVLEPLATQLVADGYLSEAFSHAVDRIAEQMIDQGHSSPPADRRDALLVFAPHQLFIVARPTGASEGSRRADR